MVPFNLASGNFDQLKLFKGCVGCGIFFLTISIFKGSVGGAIGAHGGGGGPGIPGGGGGGAKGGGGGIFTNSFLHSVDESRDLFRLMALASSGIDPEFTRSSRR